MPKSIENKLFRIDGEKTVWHDSDISSQWPVTLLYDTKTKIVVEIDMSNMSRDQPYSLADYYINTDLLDEHLSKKGTYKEGFKVLKSQELSEDRYEPVRKAMSDLKHAQTTLDNAVDSLDTVVRDVGIYDTVPKKEYLR